MQDGDTAVMSVITAVRQSNVDAVKLLVNHDATVDCRMVQCCAESRGNLSLTTWYIYSMLLLDF